MTLVTISKVWYAFIYFLSMIVVKLVFDEEWKLKDILTTSRSLAISWIFSRIFLASLGFL